VKDLAVFLKKLNILYAEDNVSIQTSTKDMLDLLFCNVYTANDGLEALELYKTKSIHIVMLDYVMPNLDGYEVAKRIRSENYKIPIVMASGYTDKEKLLNAIELCSVGYIEKPLKYEELIKTLKRTVEVLKEQNIFISRLDESTYYDFTTKTVVKNNVNIHLSKQESDCIELLIHNKAKLVSKELINDYVFSSDYVDANTIRNLLYRLRKKIDTNVIVTVKDLGYILQ
jgi:DNA-binding response OmpR family regulator